MPDGSVAYRLALPAPHPGQKRIGRQLRRFNHLRMGRRWGKTFFGLDYLIDGWAGKGGAIQGNPVGWFAPTNKYLGDPWREAKRLLAPLISYKNETDHRLELWTGGSIEFWTLDIDDPARGRKYAKVVIDEAAMVRKLLDKWQQSIRPTLTDYRGGALFASTPKGRNDFRRLEDRNRDRANWAFFHAPTVDNPHIEAEEVEEARADVPDLVFRQEYGAEYVDMGGNLVRPEFLRTGVPADVSPIVVGVDLAISTKTTANYTAIVVMTRDREGRLFVLYVIRFRGTFNEILLAIVRVCSRFAPVSVMVEANQFQAAVVQELIRTTALPVRPVIRDKDKLTAFLPLATRYENRNVYHAPDLPQYFEDEVLGFTGTPDDDNDDCVDAMGNAFAGMGTIGGSVASAGRRETSGPGP